MEIVEIQRTKRFQAGHPWIFSNELARSPRHLEPGGLVELRDRRGSFLGIGYANPQSLIAVRVLTRQREIIDAAFIRRRIARALEARARLCPDRTAMRLIFSEADGLPGLIVDRFADCLVVQLLTQGMERLRTNVLEALDALISPTAIVLRNDSRARRLEGLDAHTEVFKGPAHPRPAIPEARLRFEVDPVGGQKTGFFLDQRDNRVAFARLARGRRGLDLFCYCGAWALHLARAGLEVTAVDSSQAALTRADENAALNDLSGKLHTTKSDAFDFLARAEAEGERFDAVVVDPPAFAKGRQQLKKGLAAYRRLNAVALRLAGPSGLVASSSCSYHVSRDAFLEMLRRAARDARREVRLVGLYGQGIDHPIPLAFPEAEYLKCAFLEVR